MKTIEIKSGDTPTIRLTARNSSKVAVNIASYTSASIKIAKNLDISNTDALYYELVLAANFSDGVNGIHDFVISEDDAKDFPSGDYMLQVRLIDGSGVVTSNDIEQVNIKKNLIDDEV